MNSKHMIAAFCAAGLACGALADDSKPAPEAEETAELSWAPGDGVTYGETSIVQTEVGVAFDSRYMTYGVIDGKDPIVTPSATMTFFDWVYLGVSSIFDVTKGNGKRGGYGNRAGKYTTLDSAVGLAHEFDLGEDVCMFGFDFNYIYEYIRRYYGSMDDTQYLSLAHEVPRHRRLSARVRRGLDVRPAVEHRTSPAPARLVRHARAARRLARAADGGVTRLNARNQNENVALMPPQTICCLPSPM